MAQSKAEREFRRRFPHTRLEVESYGSGTLDAYKRYVVYAGDYLCTASVDRAHSFKQALEWVNAGLISPDPAERGTEG